jgi:ADP-ribosyl-[dinitrogen reductase] hydrolase
MTRKNKAGNDAEISPNGLVMNSVDVPGGGRIGLHRCPGANGHLRGDLHWLAAMPAELMLTLITSEELHSMGLSDFFVQAKNAGLVCHHLPISDMHAPEAGFKTNWHQFVNEARIRLANDELVLMHCRAGIGRAGTMAATLLVDAGVTPSDAIRQVRQARPGALETQDQEDWVLALDR